MTTADSEPALGGLAFGGTWRGYQQLALELFEAGRERGQQQTHIVAPPGSGKTLLGLELLRRLGARALVLAPNRARSRTRDRAASGPGARERIAALRTGGVATVVLDECHHLASMWVTSSGPR